MVWLEHCWAIKLVRSFAATKYFRVNFIFILVLFLWVYNKRLKTDGIQYETTALGTISAQSINVTSITRSGATATVTTTSAHNLGTGVSVTMSGAHGGNN